MEQFEALVDHPRFYETMHSSASKSEIASVSLTEESDTNEQCFTWGSNTDAIGTGQLLAEFFAFYGYTFESDKYAIDIRHSKQPSLSGLMPKAAPYRPRQEFVSEAERELAANALKDSTLEPTALFSKHS